jgi:plastocyanin
VIVIKMVDGTTYGMRFEPIRVWVQYGDTLRFVQTGHTPHNVEFRSAPAGTELDRQRVGPLLAKRGETYDVVIDRRFAVGKHLYVCTPHEVLGMAGLLYVGEPPN